MSDSPECRMTAMVEHQIGQIVMRLLGEAHQEDKLNRRAEARHPYFRPVSITPADQPQVSLSAFSREISRSGIGLLHTTPLTLGSATVTVFCSSGEGLRAKVQVMWCRPCGEGWHMSGCRFTDLVSS
jgi:hypothetical protein